MAGVPFDLLEHLATPKTAVSARQLVRAQQEIVQGRCEVDQFLRRRGHELSKELFRGWKNTSRHGAPPPSRPILDVFERYRASKRKLDEAESCFAELIHDELLRSRRALLRSAREILPAYLVFAR